MNVMMDAWKFHRNMVHLTVAQDRRRYWKSGEPCMEGCRILAALADRLINAAEVDVRAASSYPTIGCSIVFDM
jgi:hypothetical protein